MNIAVITFYDADNMGAMVQAIALKKYLQRRGHNVTHIKIRDNDEIMRCFEKNCPVPDVNVVRYFPRFLKHPIDNAKLFSKFIDSCKIIFWIKKRKKIFIQYLNEMSAVNIGEKIFDLYILGSDEIWNISDPLSQQSIFWGEKYKPAVVYAASMSGAKEEDFKRFPNIINKFYNFDRITVRDINSQRIIKSLTGCSVDRVVDPTILLENDRLVIADTTKKDNYILLYGYPYQWKKSAKYIKKFAKEENLKIISLWFYLDFANKNILCLPEDFISYFAKAKYVVTTTFHGSIFSILSKSQFVVYAPRDKGRQLLEEFNQRDRIIEPNNNYEKFEEILRTPCDYDKTFEIIKEKRKNSSEILDGMIQKYEERKNNN